MKLRFLAGFVLLLSGCPHPVYEDGGTGGAGGGGAGGGGGEVGGGQQAGGGTGGGQQNGGGGQLGGGGQSGGRGGGGQVAQHGLAFVVHQPDQDAGSVFIGWPGPGYLYWATANCDGICVYDPPADAHFQAFFTAGGFTMRAQWTSDNTSVTSPTLIGDITGRAYTQYDVSFALHNLLFRTAGKYQPGMLGDGDGGVAIADGICNQDAAQRGFGGHYVAWLSTQAHPAASRIPAGVRGWVSVVHGQRVPNLQFGFGDLLQPVFDLPGDSWLLYPVVGSEDTLVATGTTDWGAATANCNDWTSSDPNQTYVSGSSATGSPGFTNSGVSSCDTAASLYCLQIDRTDPLTLPVESVQHLAFVTASTYPSGGGLAAFDQACNGEASNAHLPGAYKALVATQNTIAVNRFTTSFDDYGRLDGVKLGNVENAGYLPPFTVSSHTALQVTADGRILLPTDPARPVSAKVLQGDVRVWGGAADPIAPAADNCTDWLSTQGTATIARADTTIGAWNAGSAACTERLHLFCLQTP